MSGSGTRPSSTPSGMSQRSMRNTCFYQLTRMFSVKTRLASNLQKQYGISIPSYRTLFAVTPYRLPLKKGLTVNLDY